MERSKVQLVDWDQYIPDPKKRNKTYNEFFNCLQSTALRYPQRDPAYELKRSLASLKMRVYARAQAEKLDFLSDRSAYEFLRPYTKTLIELIQKDVFHDKIAEEAFRKIIPGYRDL